MPAGDGSSDRGKDLPLLKKQLGLVNFKEPCVCRPCEAKGSRIHAGSENDNLTYLVLSGGMQEKIIEKLGPDHNTKLGWSLFWGGKNVSKILRNGPPDSITKILRNGCLEAERRISPLLPRLT